MTVFELTSDQAACSECGVEICKGQLLFLDKQQPLCLTCADLDHLEFLPSGDIALTRRTRKYSPLMVSVVRFSRARKRYERQGILATPDAIARAERNALERALGCWRSSCEAPADWSTRHFGEQKGTRN